MKDVLGAAVLSRCWVASMAIISRLLIVPYDTSAITHSKSIFSAFAAWDGVYFMDIAQDGYAYENTHAFFPMYPLLVRWMSGLFSPFLDENAAILITGWIISNGSFVIAACYLYNLGSLLLNDNIMAKRAAYFFCFCPSGIFMSSCYSESLMCALTFSGMYFLECYRLHSSGRSFHLFLSAILFGLSSATRSNGILHSLYIAYYRLCESPHPVRALPRFLVYWLVTAALGVIAVGPQVAYFVYGIAAYCPSFNLHGIQAFFSIESKAIQDRPWCSKVVPNFSAMYMFIQQEYWGVGPFAYYQLKQIPNFLLASPMIALAFYSVWLAFSSVHTEKLRQAKPYFIHLAFLLLNALVVVHIQVITRFLAPCPTIFWAAACLHDRSKLTTSGKVLTLYFLVFNVVGSVLFPSFYPWT